MHPFSEWLMMNVGSRAAEQALDIVGEMLRDEREACAKLADRHAEDAEHLTQAENTAILIAADIRARR